jgi:hypothetical protein
MKHGPLAIGAASLIAAGALFGAGRLSAQPGRPKLTSRAGLARSPIAAGQPLVSQAAAQSRISAASRRLTGVLILFEYDPDLSVSLDLDGNGDFIDTGDRNILQGTIWQSNRSGGKIARLGQFASIFDLLDVSGEDIGTDITTTTDMRFAGSGQVRAGGFWNVDDFLDAPALSVSGATGSSSLRRYKTGQLVFLARVKENEELYLLAR